MTDASQSAVPKAQLTLFRSVCIIVGVIVGSGIFESPPDIAFFVSDWWGLSPATWFLLIWVIGGAISLLGALCYAELATAYPRSGGDYVYLNRAFGGWCGFLFGWARLAIIQGGSIGAIAYVFGDYATRLLPLAERTILGEGGEETLVHTLTISLGAMQLTLHSAAIYAAIATVILTVVNILGVREGAMTQNILTTVKVLGLGAVFVAAFLLTPGYVPPATPAEIGAGSFALTMVFVSWTYGGWNEIAYVAAEVENPNRNIVRSLLIGLAIVTGIYLLVNLAFIHTLGVQGVAGSKAVAADVMNIRFGEFGARLISGLVVISALGALNGFILTSARVYYAMGTEHRLLSVLGRWSKRFGTPIAALILQGAIIITLIIAFGDREGFRRMVKFTAAAFWLFIGLTTCSLVILRFRDKNTERPFRVPLYPLIPAFFLAFCIFMVYRSLDYAPVETAWAAGIIALGVPVYILSRLLSGESAGAENGPPGGA
jgi:amino acid transporter